MMPSMTMIFSTEIMSTLKEIKYHLKQSYHKQKSYPLPYPTLTYPTPYPTLPFTLPYPTPYPTLPLTYPTPYPTLYPTLPPTLPSTLPYPLPYPTLPNPPYPYPSLPYPTPPHPYRLPYPTLSLPLTPYPTLPYPLPNPTLNQPVNLPSMNLSHVRYSLMSVSVFSCVILGLFWSVSLRSRLFWSVSVIMTPRCLKTRGWVLVKLLSLYRLEPSYNNNMATGIRSQLLFLHLRTSLINLLFTSVVCPT